MCKKLRWKEKHNKQKKLNCPPHIHAIFVSSYMVCSNQNFAFAQFILQCMSTPEAGLHDEDWRNLGME
jgi:hypothetical protein